MEISIENEFLKASFLLKGAELNSLINKNDEEFIWEGNPNFWGKHSPVLFPIVGALKNDTYSLNSITYSLSRHGFARDFNFEIIKKTSDSITFSLKNNSETIQKFPFQFELKIQYKFNNTILEVYFEVLNHSNCILPYCIGAHPAFKLHDAIENYSIEFENDDHLIANNIENNLFNNFTKVVPLENNKLNLNYKLFENDALVFKSLKSKSVILSNKNKKVIKVNFNDFSSLGIWTVTNSSFVCIEPWIGYADSIDSSGNFYEKDNVILLKPNESKKVMYTIEIL
jgi:galactose mutarotase-like enzyme